MIAPSPAPGDPAVSRPVALVVAGLVLAAFALRCWGLADHALWRDELCSLVRADGHRSFGVPETGVVIARPPLAPGPPLGVLTVLHEPNEFIPPLYFVLLRGWKNSFGEDAAALRALSVLASTLAVLLGALLAGVLRGPRAAMVAALLLALSPLEYRYGQEARPYALMAVFALLATLAFARLQTARERRGLLWALYVGSLVAAIGTHYTALLVPVAHTAYTLVLRQPAALRTPRAALLASLLLLAPIVFLMAWQYSHHQADEFETLDWLAGATAAPIETLAPRENVVYDALALGGGFVSGLQSPPLKAALHGLLVAGLVVGGLFAADRRPWLPFLLAVGGPLALLVVDSLFGTNGLQVPRYAFVSSPFVWVAAAIGLCRLRGAAFALALTLVAAGELDGTVRSHDRQTLADDIRSAAAAVQEQGCDERDLVVALLDVPEQINELNQFLTGDPFEMVLLADLHLDEAGLARPWRHVFVLAVATRRQQAERIRELLLPRFELRRALETERLVCTSFRAR